MALPCRRLDRVVGRGLSVGYWRWWGDRYQHLLVAWDQGRNGAVLGEAVSRRRIARLDTQSERLARRLRHAKIETGRFGAWARRQDERRLEELKMRVEAEREALFGRPAPPEPHHRISDSDREETVADLSRAHEEGRLDTAELEERIGRGYAALTYAQLEALVVDIRAGERAPRCKRRVSDREREGAVAVLRAALGEGRLSADEFSERAQRAFEARSAEEVTAVLRDLPDSYALRMANAS